MIGRNSWLGKDSCLLAQKELIDLEKVETLKLIPDPVQGQEVGIKGQHVSIIPLL